MESLPNIKYCSKPNFSEAKLPYLKTNENGILEKEIYVNLFKITIKKALQLFQYPYAIEPPVDPTNMLIRSKLFRKAKIGKEKDKNVKRPKDFYGECFVFGDSLYGMKEVKEMKTFTSKLYKKGKKEFTITIQPKAKQRTIHQEDVENDPLSKQFIEMLIRDILHANPNLDFHKGLFVLKSKKKRIDSKFGSIDFYPGYTTSFMETEGGNYLNVTLKNKILSSQTILDDLEENNYDEKFINDKLIGNSFKVSYAKKNYRIDDISFDRTPENTEFEYDGEKINLIKYYEDIYKIKIKDRNQPLIIMRKKDEDNDGNPITLYFIPELCYMAGLTDEHKKDRDFMKQLADLTKLTPMDRVNRTNEFLSFLVETKIRKPREGENEKDILSSKEKSEKYGIEVTALNKKHKAYVMNKTILECANKEIIKSENKQFEVLSKKDMKNWICLYNKSNYENAKFLYEKLIEASESYGLSISKPTWIEMEDRDNAQKWADTANKEMSTKQYSFALFLLDRNDKIYKKLKLESLCKKGYVSQVVRVSSLYNKNILSVCSKILLQINAKLSGVSYKVQFDKNIKNRRLIVIGIDSSHIKGKKVKRTGIAMVATVNNTFTNFYNKEQIFEENVEDEDDVKINNFCLSIGSFIKEAIVQYNKLQGKLPGGIVIYRQGVSFHQKKFLEKEVLNIQKVCNENKLLYEYILVNTKTTYKFFEKKGNKYENPEAGLLVLKGVTDRKLFEFYIQPQKVTGGSATPSCFTVAYGNFDFPEIIPKLTFDLCSLYSNWQGTIRVPHVLKCAEKLSKMTAKYTGDELNYNLKLGQAYL